MIENEELKIQKIILAIRQLKESGLKGKLIIYINNTEIKDCEILTKLEIENLVIAD